MVRRKGEQAFGVAERLPSCRSSPDSFGNVYWLALGALLWATIIDLRKREIPNRIPLLVLGAAIVARLYGWHPVTWTALFGGLAVGFVCGALLFRLGGFGGGDVKLLGALGAALGWGAMVPFLLATGILGGLFALRAKRRGEAHQPMSRLLRREARAGRRRGRRRRPERGRSGIHKTG